MADSALVTVGVVEGTLVVDALNIVRKGGAVVVTALASFGDPSPALPMSALAIVTIFQKRLLGSLYGETNPRADIPRLLSLYREGKLMLDEAVTTEYKLADVNEAYDDMLAGRIIRGVVIHEH
jgi:S-(hydroxymethyl)glutathione dehydrogenase/alcohol dehydrogenase